MAELSPIEKLKIIEDDFQKWFRKAYELKDYTDVDVDLLVRNLSRRSLKIQRYRYYETQFKSTIKVPPQYQDTPNLFINALGKYFVDSAKFLYKDQIRYSYTGFESNAPGDWCWVDVYKSCGDEVGCFCIIFQLEGNLIVAAVGYQIFGQVMPLVSHPEMLKAFNQSALSATGRDELLGSVATIGNGLRYLLLCICALFCVPFCAFLFMGIGLFCVLWPFLNERIAKHNRERKTRLYRRETAIQQDLSPIYFPVKYFYTDDFKDAFTKSHDHQIFFKQLEAVVNQMSALGESANRAE